MPEASRVRHGISVAKDLLSEIGAGQEKAHLSGEDDDGHGQWPMLSFDRRGLQLLAAASAVYLPLHQDGVGGLLGVHRSIGSSLGN